MQRPAPQPVLPLDAPLPYPHVPVRQRSAGAIPFYLGLICFLVETTLYVFVHSEFFSKVDILLLMIWPLMVFLLLLHIAILPTAIFSIARGTIALITTPQSVQAILGLAFSSLTLLLWLYPFLRYVWSR